MKLVPAASVCWPIAQDVIAGHGFASCSSVYQAPNINSPRASLTTASTTPLLTAQLHTQVRLIPLVSLLSRLPTTPPPPPTYSVSGPCSSFRFRTYIPRYSTGLHLVAQTSHLSPENSASFCYHSHTSSRTSQLTVLRQFSPIPLPTTDTLHNMAYEKKAVHFGGGKQLLAIGS